MQAFNIPSATPPLILQADHTASYWAARRGNLEALRTLLAAGANPAATDNMVRGCGWRLGEETCHVIISSPPPPP